MRLRLLATVLGSIALLVAACSSGASPTPGTPSSSITAQLSEWQMKLDSSLGKAGTVTFTIVNKGEKTHEFVVVKTDTAADKLPVVDDEVPEAQLEAVDEIEDIKAGTTETLTLEGLQPGHYVILCNLTGHYAKGMHAEFDVQ
jgi:uncharacterized cupredoxin-like copper-binding protein